ncbi:MAG: ABC transporter substrate-binding protein [bacterium]
MPIRLKNLVWYCPIILLLSFLFFCSKEIGPAETARSGGTYRIPVTADITSLDPTSGQLHSWSIGGQIYEGLVTYSRDETILIPLLAERYTVDDLALTFYLRKGITFHDDPCFPDGKGRELTAADVKYSIERSYDPVRLGKGVDPGSATFVGFKEYLHGEAAHIEGLKALDKYTFVIELAQPDPGLLSGLAGQGGFILPKEAVEFYGPDFKWHPVGTGPFRFAEIIPNEKLILVMNVNYWAHEGKLRLPYLDAVEYVLYAPDESEKMFLDFQTRKIDECTEEVARYLTDLVELDRLGGITFKGWLKTEGVQLLKDKLFRKLRYLEITEKNKKVRQAMCYALNRKRMVENQENIFQVYEIAKGPVPSSALYFNEALEGQNYDPDRARRLLQEAGFPNGQGLAEYPFISLPSPDADFIVADLEAVGFKIKKMAPFPGWRDWLEQGKPLLVRMMSIATSPEVYDHLYGVPQAECLVDTLYIRIFKECHKNQENYRNKHLLNRLEEILVELAPEAFLYHIDGEIRFLQREVRGRQLGNAWGHKLHYVWFEHEIHK